MGRTLLFEHGGTGNNVGQNIAAGQKSIAVVLKDFMNEKSQYDPSNPKPSHFTQVVWKGTTHVGCFVATCNGILDNDPSATPFYVCNYSPAGNIEGDNGVYFLLGIVSRRPHMGFTVTFFISQ